jgi:hypothetical protein
VDAREYSGAARPAYRANSPGLYQMVKHQPVLDQFFSAGAEFSHCERARARLNEEIERRRARVAAANREEAAFVGDAVAFVLESGALPPSFAQSVAALDRRREAEEIRVLTTMRDDVMRRLESIAQSNLDAAFAHLHALVVQTVDEGRTQPRAAEPSADATSGELADRYSELRATQQALLRQVGFGSGDWRSAAIVRNVAKFWPEWHRFRRAGSSLPPWPADDLRQQFGWMVTHPDAAVWVPTPTALDEFIETAIPPQGR